MTITKIAVISAAVMTIGMSSAYAGDKDPEFLCSPGYFKNHVDTWAHLFDETTVTNLLADMNATGAHNGELKQAAASFINTALLAVGDLPCEDGDPVGGDD